jgi:hypothetical protein
MTDPIQDCTHPNLPPPPRPAPSRSLHNPNSNRNTRRLLVTTPTVKRPAAHGGHCDAVRRPDRTGSCLNDWTLEFLLRGSPDKANYAAAVAAAAAAAYRGWQQSWPW